MAKSNNSEERLRIARVNRLKQTPLFGDIVKKRYDGISALQCAIWAVSVKTGHKSESWSVSYWERLILALGPEIKKVERKIETEQINPVQVAAASLISQQVEETTGQVMARHNPEAHRQMWQEIRSKIQDRNAEVLLHWLFIENEKRFAVARKLEESTGLILPEVSKLSDVMCRIAEAIARTERDQKMIRLRADPLIAADATPMGPVAQMMAEFDVVDRNLIRQSGNLFLDLVKEGSTGAFQIKRVETDPSGAGRAATEADVRDASEDVAGSATQIRTGNRAAATPES